MYFSGLTDNLKQMREIVRELYIFSNQLNYINNLESGKNIVIDRREKYLLENSIDPLFNQLKILNRSLPELVGMVGVSNLTPNVQLNKKEKAAPLSKVEYQPTLDKKISVVISDKDRDDFLNNLNKSKLSVNKLKKKYGKTKEIGVIGKPSAYATISNRIFRKISINLVNKGYFKLLNKNLRKVNSRFVVSTYVSMMLFTGMITAISSLFLYLFILFFNISPLFPFISFATDPILGRALRFSWIVVLLPVLSLLGMYFFPYSEAKNLGGKIDRELPFVTIHMSAIASSGVEPVKMFEIILRGKDYKYVTVEFKKLLNLINFHGEDIVGALRKISISSSSAKLRELLNGFAVAITTGGNLNQFLHKHSETLLFDYRLEREKYTKISETFMDIYISVAIAAPMILLMIFVIIGGSGLIGGFLNLSLDVLSMLLILIIVLINVFFIMFLKIKQPPM